MPSDNRRTKMIHIYTPHAGVYRLEIERETIRTYENADAIPVPALNRNVHRTAEAIADQALPGGPVTISTFGELQALISSAADALEAEDIAAQEGES